MWNYIRSLLGDLKFMGMPAGFLLNVLNDVPEAVDDGLIGEAQLVPYTVLRV